MHVTLLLVLGTEEKRTEQEIRTCRTGGQNRTGEQTRSGYRTENRAEPSPGLPATRTQKVYKTVDVSLAVEIAPVVASGGVICIEANHVTCITATTPAGNRLEITPWFSVRPKYSCKVKNCAKIQDSSVAGSVWQVTRFHESL